MAFRLTAVLSKNFKETAYYWSGFHKYGLFRDDCLYETEDVLEALRRIPRHLVDERNYRLLRATQLSIQNIILPKEQWTKYEDDKLYLTPVIKQIEMEKLEREKWENDH